MIDYEAERLRMVDDQIAARGLTDPRLLEVFWSVPRHRFVPDEYAGYAYEDSPLPIGFHQTISQPYIVALMTDLLKLDGPEHVLEVGTGSGYQSAVLSRMVAVVHTVEFIPELARQAAVTLHDLGYANVICHVGDGSPGWPPAAPYDAIMITAAAPLVPQPLLDQLAEGGRLVAPIGGRGYQQLELWTKRAGNLQNSASIPVAFVPLRGKHGWGKNGW